MSAFIDDEAMEESTYSSDATEEIGSGFVSEYLDLCDRHNKEGMTCVACQTIFCEECCEYDILLTESRKFRCFKCILSDDKDLKKQLCHFARSNDLYCFQPFDIWSADTKNFAECGNCHWQYCTMCILGLESVPKDYGLAYTCCQLGPCSKCQKKATPPMMCSKCFGTFCAECTGPDDGEDWYCPKCE